MPYKFNRITSLRKASSLTVVLILYSAEEAQLADSTRQFAPAHCHLLAKSNSCLSDAHVHIGSGSRKRNRKEMRHNKMLCFAAWCLVSLICSVTHLLPGFHPTAANRQAWHIHLKQSRSPTLTSLSLQSLSSMTSISRLCGKSTRVQCC